MIAISVVIPTFRHQKTLRELLGSLKRQACDVAFEVIVIANLPEVGLKKIVESYGPRFRFHETGRVGANIARNKGFDLARGKTVLFLDDDTYLNDRDFVQKHAQLHARYPQAIAIGGPFTPKAGMTPVESAYHWILDHQLASARLERDEARTLSASNVSMKRELLENRHRFDDRVKFGASEESFFSKLRGEQNLLLSFNSISVEHRARLNLWSLMRKGFYQGYGQQLVASDASSTLERPHWNSSRPLDETFRAAHVQQTPTFRIAVRLYKKAHAYGKKQALRDSVPLIATTAIKHTARPRADFSFATFISLLISERRGRRLAAAFLSAVTSLRAADLLAVTASTQAAPVVQKP